MKIEKLIVILAAMLLGMGAGAQNLTSSPYSRYAYGDLNENVPTAYRAMGGVGFAMRSNRAINPSQPASYTSCDTLTFMFDLAASASWSRYQDASGQRNKANGSLEYVTMQFPIWKRWIAMSVGLLPYSSVGYDITLSGKTQGNTYSYTSAYQGRGNISEVYGGLSFNLFNWVAVGANVYYMWGDLYRARALVFDQAGLNPTLQDEILSVSNVRVRYGAQFFHTWGKHAVVAGMIMEHKMRLHSDYILIETQSADSIPIYEGGWQLPTVWGLGASYTWNNRLTVAFDYERQHMATALFNGMAGHYSGLQNRSRYALGLEFRNNPVGRRYGDRMMWRLGASIQDEYLVTIGAKRYTASVGIGFPMHGSGTMLNTTIEYTHRGSKSSLEEHSLRFTLGISVAETWFLKRKL